MKAPLAYFQGKSFVPPPLGAKVKLRPSTVDVQGCKRDESEHERFRANTSFPGGSICELFLGPSLRTVFVLYLTI